MTTGRFLWDCFLACVKDSLVSQNLGELRMSWHRLQRDRHREKIKVDLFHNRTAVLGYIDLIGETNILQTVRGPLKKIGQINKNDKKMVKK